MRTLAGCLAVFFLAVAVWSITEPDPRGDAVEPSPSIHWAGDDSLQFIIVSGDNVTSGAEVEISIPDSGDTLAIIRRDTLSFVVERRYVGGKTVFTAGGSLTADQAARAFAQCMGLWLEYERERRDLWR